MPQSHQEPLSLQILTSRFTLTRAWSDHACGYELQALSQEEFIKSQSCADWRRRSA